MITLGVVVPYIGLTQKWSAAKVEATGDHIVVNRKFITSFGANLHCDSSEFFSLTLTYKVGLNTQ